MEKDLFEIFSILVSPELYISECGGPLYLGFYAKKSLGINWFPYGYLPENYDYILRKNIYDKISKKIISTKFCDKNFSWQYELSDRYDLKLNNINQIYRAIDKVLN